MPLGYFNFKIDTMHFGVKREAELAACEVARIRRLDEPEVQARCPYGFPEVITIINSPTKIILPKSRE